MAARIPPLLPPYPDQAADLLRRMMPGEREPIALFRTYARNLPLAEAAHGWGAYELGRRLSFGVREREILIDRTCAQCGCEYEWGVHVAEFADRAELAREQIASLAHGTSADACWTSERDRVLIDAADALHEVNDLDDVLWARLAAEFGEEQILDLLMLCGWYHAISFTARAARLAPEPGAARFADYGPSRPDRQVTIVRACLREGAGGSPTAVLADVPMTDDERRRVPVEAGTSHAVFVSADEESGVVGSGVSLRFFTAEGELPACGHGTIAALAYLAARAESGAPEAALEHSLTLRASGRSFQGHAVRRLTQYEASFDPGPVALRPPTETEYELVLPALGLRPDQLAAAACVASVGRERLLVPVGSRSALVELEPDQERLRAACDRLGLLGCFVYSAPSATGSLAARMFAPSIGVPEDIANANSTACLAAHLAGQGLTDIAVDMGDALGSPATITARARRTAGGIVVHVGGVAEITLAG